MLLHVVSKSPWDGEALHSCLRVALPGSVILLLEDGVYAAIAGCEAAQQIALQADIRCFALTPDIEARGLGQRLDANIELANFDDFVRLSTECHAVQSWY